MGIMLIKRVEGGAPSSIILKADMQMIEGLRATERVSLRLFNREDGSSAVISLVNTDKDAGLEENGPVMFTVSQTREEFVASLTRGLEAIFWNGECGEGVKFRALMLGKDGWLGELKPLCEPIQ